MIATLVALGTLLAGLAYAVPPELSVCEVASAGGKLDGKMVRVSGVWRKAFPAATIFEELVDDRCPETEIHVVATDASLPYAPPSGYKPDLASIRKADRIARKALADKKDLRVTMVGVLYVQKKDDYVPGKPLSKDLTVPPHHKWYPLVLLIRAIPDVKER